MTEIKLKPNRVIINGHLLIRAILVFVLRAQSVIRHDQAQMAEIWIDWNGIKRYYWPYYTKVIWIIHYFCYCYYAFRMITFYLNPRVIDQLDEQLMAIVMELYDMGEPRPVVRNNGNII